MFSGRCVGGPYHGKPTHHPERSMPLWVYDANPMKTVSRAPSAPPEPGISKGHYRYEDVKGIWIWYPPA